MMRKVLAFLVWLFSFWAWKDFFLSWLRKPPFYPASGERAGSEHLPCQEGHPESEWSRFLSFLTEDERCCIFLKIDGDSKVELKFGPREEYYQPDMEAGYLEFLEAVASSEVVFHEEFRIHLIGDNSLIHMEAFANALRQSRNTFRILKLGCYQGHSPISLAKCVSCVLLKIDTIEGLHLSIHGLKGKIGKEEAMKLMTVVGVPQILQILKSLLIDGSEWEDEGMEQLLKPFNSLDNVLESFNIFISSNAQLEHISGLLATSTSPQRLHLNNEKGIEWIRGYTSIASALCSNRSLQYLGCTVSSCMELKALLDPLMPKTDNLQPNTTLTQLKLVGAVGGKEGIETLVAMLCTNMSLLELSLFHMNELSSKDAEAIDNILAILEALKTNKSLKKIGFHYCSGVGGSKVFGAMMDLLLENHCIEDISLIGTPLEDSGDAEYVYSALSKRKKMNLWGIVQGMANVKPTSGRVFLCGQPFAGKTRLRLSMKQFKEFQEQNEVQNTSRFGNRMRKVFKKSKVSKVPKEDILLERTQGIEVDNVLCDGIGISIWEMAGQTDYHSFHKLVMPNFSANGSCSIFLLMCDPMEQLDP